MQRLQRLSFLLPAISAILHLPVSNQVKDYQFSATAITITPNIFFEKSYAYFTTTQSQTV